MEQPVENPAPGLVLEQALEEAAAAPVVDAAEPLAFQEDGSRAETLSFPRWLDDAGMEIIRATRSWIQYGTVGFAVMCIIIGAVEGLFGR